MVRRSPVKWPQWPGRFGLRGSYDPFYQFKPEARDNGKRHESPEPKVERQLLAVLGSNAALVVLSCVLVVVALALIVLVTARLG